MIKNMLGLLGRQGATPGRSGHSLTAGKRGAKQNGAASRWHAISIAPGSTCCQAAEATNGKRYLSKTAPDLPLPDCDQQHCSCRYQHHVDRRMYGLSLDRIGVALPSLRRRATD